MSRRETLMIAALSLIWGASFMFIKIADRQLNPSAVVFFRLVLACAVLVPVAFAVVGAGALSYARAAWKPLAGLGLVNTALPFWLFPWAETRIDSSLAGILQAAAPIFTVMLAVQFSRERVSGLRLVGFLVGFAGVALLVGSPGKGGLVASLAVVLAAFSYACGATLGSHSLGATPPLVVGATSTTVAMIVTAPLGLTHLPAALPGWKVLASISVLGVVGTGVAYIILFRLLRSAGAPRTMLITYLIPPIAVFYGCVFLGEPLRAISLGALALILLGVGLASRRTEPVRATAAAASASID